MRVAYVDMVGGAAGDMLMGAWIDAGVDVAVLEAALRSVVADGWELVAQRVVRAGLAATHVDLVIPGEDERHPGHGHHHRHGEREPHGEHGHDGHDHHPHAHHDHHPQADASASVHPQRRLADVLAIVERSGLTRRQIERAGAIYRRLAEAEARVHGTDVATVSFHEVGQVDAILDVAGTCVALDLLGIDELRCSAFPYGYGLAQMAHGIYPTPSPATTELLRGFPLVARDVEAELVTTTGAAILTTLAARPGTRPDLTLERIGYGAGRKEFRIPNVVRVLIGSDARERTDEVVVLEANIDDMSPQFYELALERIFAAGALDVWLTPATMKKGRPAVVLAALASPAHEREVAQALLRETTTIGVRARSERRVVLARETLPVETPLGTVRVKRVAVDGVERARAEYDDLLRIARERGLPLTEVARIVDAAVGDR